MESGRATIPIPGTTGRPRAISWGMSFLTASTGMAKPMPARRRWGCRWRVLTPIRRPAQSSSGPPELPGLMAASVWITSRIGRPLGDAISRPRALMTPVVRVWSSPKGLPIAKTRLADHEVLRTPPRGERRQLVAAAR